MKQVGIRRDAETDLENKLFSGDTDRQQAARELSS